MLSITSKGQNELLFFFLTASPDHSSVSKAASPAGGSQTQKEEFFLEFCGEDHRVQCRIAAASDPLLTVSSVEWPGGEATDSGLDCAGYGVGRVVVFGTSVADHRQQCHWVRSGRCNSLFGTRP